MGAAAETVNWETLYLTERQKLLVQHARHYAANYAEAGIPGSNHILLIAHLAERLDVATTPTYAEAQEPTATEETKRERLSDYIRHSDDVIRKPFSPNRDS